MQKRCNIAGLLWGTDNGGMRRIRPYWDPTQITHHAPDLGPFAVWLSWAQLITWGSVFYTFSLLMTPLEAELGMTRAQSSLAFSLALLAEGLMAYLVGRWIDAGHERLTTDNSIIMTAALGQNCRSIGCGPIR